MAQITHRRFALLLTSSLLAALLLALLLILSGSGPAQAQDPTATGAHPAGAITDLTETLPLSCFTNIDGDNDTDYESVDHLAVHQAIQAVSPGTTIRVAGACAGVSFTEGSSQTVFISKTLILEGGYDENNWAGGSDPVANPTTLDAQSGGRVVYVHAFASDVTLANLRFTGGRIVGVGGGGILVEGSVTIDGSEIYSNTAGSGGGISSRDGRVTVTHSAIYSNTANDNSGGGVQAYDEAVTVIQDSQIKGNRAAHSGGGIYLIQQAELVLVRSAVVSNTAEDFRGGGVYVRDKSRAYIENSTISGNRAEGQLGTIADRGNGGGIYLGAPVEGPSVLTVTHSTIAHNYAAGEGGGMDFNRGNNGDILTFRGTILAGNQAGGTHQDCYDYDTNNYTFNNDARNIFGGETGGDCPVGASDWSLKGSGQGIDDVLLPLAYNGGNTLNHALPFGSLAIDAGDNSFAKDVGGNPLVTDQRGPGFPRILLGKVDIGAYEFAECGIFPATAGNQEELNNAITCYNEQSAPGTYTITLDADIDLSHPTWPIDNDTQGVDLFLAGTGHAVDGQDTPGIQPFTIYVSTSVHMDDVTITGGYETIDTTVTMIGGGLTTAGFLTLTNSRVAGNHGFAGGGLAVTESGRLVVVGSLINNNTASDDGGGIASLGGRVTLDNSTILSNTAATSGGGIHVREGSYLTFTRSAVVSNTAETGRGGGVHIRQDSRARIDNTTISGNHATGLDGTSSDQGNGGGIYVGALEMPNFITVTHSTIVDNYAAGEGGGMDFNRFAPGDTLAFRATILAGNRAGGAHQNCYDYSTGNYSFTTDAYNLFNGEAGDDCPVGSSDLSLADLGQTITDVLDLELAKNGGDTVNHALILGSAAQDAVPLAGCMLPTDQRATGRPQGDDCDIGAYELDYYALTVTTAGSGSGSVSSDPVGSDCESGEGACQASYADGNLVTLTATPDKDSAFSGWSGACSGDGGCTVTMDQAQEVTATFDAGFFRFFLPVVMRP